MGAAMTKPAAGKGADQTLRRHLLRLIRQLARGDCAIEAGQAGEVRLAGAEERTYPQAVIAEARSLGLIELSEGRIAASTVASSFLRRALPWRGWRAAVPRRR
jgi:hypothetical protein